MPCLATPTLMALRLILYYPVSALVTLFANILQNPNDARARSDVKLMNVVVNFLSTLVSDESNGSIKRMLSLCGEFERIAKVVLSKAEKESHSRKKRKAGPTHGSSASQNVDREEPTSSSTPHPTTTHHFNSFSTQTEPEPAPSAAAPDFTNATETFSTPMAMMSTLPGALQTNMDGLSGIGPEYQDLLGADNMVQTDMMDQSQFTTASPASANMAPFQQPFVPQDLWQMPMTIEWDWADMSSHFPGFGNGVDPADPSHQGA